MNTKMTFGGIGPKLGLITLPYIILAMVVMQRDPHFLRLKFLDNTLAGIFGYIWISVGLVFYVATIVVFLTDFREGKLVTRGTFSLCRNPIYAAFIVFFIPGLALVFGSGMILSIAIVLYLNFKLSIHGEKIILRRNFGEAYETYEREVNEIIPLPGLRKKLQL